MKLLSMLPSALLFVCCLSCNPDKSSVLFEDSFGPESQGELRQNIIQLPPPQGLGYEWNVLESGYDPIHWKMVDELEPENPKKGFWVIPPDSSFLQQGGRSHHSVLYCITPVPEDNKSYDITFSQYRSDNDYIGYIIGADKMKLKAGIEFGYMTQVPGTDSTTSDIYIQGFFGEKMVPDMALMHTWAKHRIEVRHGWIIWYINEQMIGMKELSEETTHGYFGIRQRYERNTRYDDYQIIIYPHELVEE